MYCHRDIDELNWLSNNPYYDKRLKQNMQQANMLERIGISTVGENSDLRCYIPLEPMPDRGKHSAIYRQYAYVQPMFEENGDIGLFFERFGFKICLPYDRIRESFNVDGELVKYLKGLDDKLNEITNVAKNEVDVILALEKLELLSSRTVNIVDK